MFGFVAPWSPAKGLIALPVGAYDQPRLYLIAKGLTAAPWHALTHPLPPPPPML